MKSSAYGLCVEEFLALHCSAVHPYIDYVKLVIKLDLPLQSSTLRAKMPATWRSDSIKVTPLGKDIPGAMNPTANSTNFYALTVHEPHIHPFDVSALDTYLALIKGRISHEHCQVEFGLDFIPHAGHENHEAYKAKIGKFLLRMVSHLKHQQALGLQNARVFCPYPIGVQPPPKQKTAWIQHSDKGWTETITKNGQRPTQSCASMGTHIQHSMHRSGHGSTFYMGNTSGAISTKVHGVPTRAWQRGTELRAYFKTKDQGQYLPVVQHRYRMEFIAPCVASNDTSFNIDPINVLKGESSAACSMAKFFALVLPDAPLLSVIRMYRGINQADQAPTQVLFINGKETTSAKLLNTIKRNGKKDGIRSVRIGADAPWNRLVINKFTCQAKKMRSALFTFSAGPCSTAATPVTSPAEKTQQVIIASEEKLQKSDVQNSNEAALCTAISETPAQDDSTGALITASTTSPLGDGRCNHFITDEELFAMLEEGCC